MKKHWRTWVLLAIALWVVAVTAWALNPMSVVVTTGVNADGTQTTATVQCDSPLSGNTSPTEALPTLSSGESLSHNPCEGPVTSARTMYAIDMVVAAGILMLLVAIRRHSDRRQAADATVPEEAALRA
jgi:hypothetical protein